MLEKMSWSSAIAIGLMVLLLLHAGRTRARAAPAAQEQDEFIFLPAVTGGQEPSCAVPGVAYGTLPVAGPATDRPAAEHPDINLAIRGYTPTTAALGLVEYGGDGDALAPQLDTLFGDGRLPTFTSAFHVYKWDWACDCRGEPNDSWPVTLLGMGVSPGEVIRTPDSGYDIGGGHDALVLYAAPGRLTLKYTREDNVVSGYTIHLEDVCVEPELLALYGAANAAGRGQLPALRGGQPLGRALGPEIKAAVRDTGTLLDPRSRKDWWKARGR